MAIEFPNAAWVAALKDKLNSDENHARIAKKWEGDILFQIEPDEKFPERQLVYLDLMHGSCRDAFIVDETNQDDINPEFILTASFTNLLDVLEGRLEPMQAMITRKLKVSGSMAYMMRNVPVVIDFVRCAREVT